MLALHKISRLLKPRKRVGRGGSRGGQSGRGGKGQTARSGGSTRPGFEGGQMPLHRRLPKRGFTNHPFQKEVLIINLRDLERVFLHDSVVDRETLLLKGLIKNKSSNHCVIKVLGDGELTKKMTIIADSFSKSAKEAIEKVGGVVVCQAKGE
jgi:large subunit ribosomal protein L15